MKQSTQTPSSHCSVDVHVFWGTTAPLSVMQAPLGSTALSQLAGSASRATHDPASHCRVSVQVFWV